MPYPRAEAIDQIPALCPASTSPPPPPRRLYSGRLEDDLNPVNSISQTTRNTNKASSTTASSARLKAAARKVALMARGQVLKDGLELKLKPL